MHAFFVNLTAFTARLLQDEVLTLLTWAVVALSGFLERDYHQPNEQLLDTFVSAAAKVVMVGGVAVYGHDREVTVAGPLLETAREKGKVERWRFWKERFRGIWEREDLKDSTRAVGEEAVERMEEIEREGR